MRVTIEHREATSGLLGNHKDTYIECRVDFSEEEKAIIAARDLYRSGFTVRTSTPLPTQTALLGSGLMRPVGVVMMIVGVVWGIAGGGTPTLVFLFFVGGLRAFHFRLVADAPGKTTASSQRTSRTLRSRAALPDPRFTVHAWDPAVCQRNRRYELSAMTTPPALKQASFPPAPTSRLSRPSSYEPRRLVALADQVDRSGRQRCHRRLSGAGGDHPSLLSAACFCCRSCSFWPSPRACTGTLIGRRQPINLLLPSPAAQHRRQLSRAGEIHRGLH